MSPTEAKPVLAPAVHAPAPAAAPGTSVAPAPAAPRPRQQGRKKAVPIEPDSLYRAASNSTSAPAPPPTVAGAKRGAQDRGEGEPRKRKRVDHHHAAAASHAGASNASGAGSGAHPTHAKQSANASALGKAGLGPGSAIASAAAAANNISNSTGPAMVPDADGQPSLFEFSTLPTSALYQYIIQYDLVPAIYPTPLTAEDPPPPVALLDPARMASRAPTPTPLLTPANRPRRSRETKEAASRRRSTRLLEEELRGGLEQVPVLADVGELHGVLATIAQRHFRESSVREVDMLATFMGAVKARR